MADTSANRYTKALITLNVIDSVVMIQDRYNTSKCKYRICLILRFLTLDADVINHVSLSSHAFPHSQTIPHYLLRNSPPRQFHCLEKRNKNHSSSYLITPSLSSLFLPHSFLTPSLSLELPLAASHTHTHIY